MRNSRPYTHVHNDNYMYRAIISARHFRSASSRWFIFASCRHVCVARHICPVIKLICIYMLVREEIFPSGRWMVTERYTYQRKRTPSYKLYVRTISASRSINNNLATRRRLDAALFAAVLIYGYQTNLQLLSSNRDILTRLSPWSVAASSHLISNTINK